jgi:hypothetical protein
MHHARLVSRTTDPDFVCTECGAVSIAKVWEFDDPESTDTASVRTFRRCSADPEHMEPQLREAIGR